MVQFAMKSFVLAMVAMTATSISTQAAEKIANPEFASWSKFKPGTSITWKMTSEFGKQSSVVIMTTKLLEVKGDTLVLETTTQTEIMGMKIDAPAQKRDVTKEIELPVGVAKPPLPGAKPEGTTEEGTETVKAAGAEFKTKWYKYTVKAAEGTTGQIWTSDDVPTSVVKMTSKSATYSTTMELIEFKKP